MGRMLNTITGGYAVGVGGIVAFLPFSSCSLVSAGRIGALQARRPNGSKDAPSPRGQQLALPAPLPLRCSVCMALGRRVVLRGCQLGWIASCNVSWKPV